LQLYYKQVKIRSKELKEMIVIEDWLQKRKRGREYKSEIKTNKNEIKIK
jgi:hypothetical protein